MSKVDSFQRAMLTKIRIIYPKMLQIKKLFITEFRTKKSVDAYAYLPQV